MTYPIGFLRRLLVLLAALALAPAAHAQEFPERGTAPVVDAANIIDEATEAQLTQQLSEFEQRNQRQFVIATLPDLQGYDIADYGYRLGREWGIGDSERDDGVLLIVAPNERLMRIEVGYGLEGILPDGLAFEYIEEMKDYFREGEFSAGIAQGAQRIVTQLELPPEEAAAIAQQATQERANAGEGGFPIGALIWLGFILFFFVLPMFGRRGKRRFRGGGAGGFARDIILWEVGKAVVGGLTDSDGGGFGGGGFGGGGFGGGGGGFGGFSGGGGSFGGGGASG
ncbi:MAG: TPM domain-containing protein, partial [Alphaproteobacteria bacterium]|nr:TPM domain-containing protein [Alphaproteobacteria bacterium]